MVMVNLIDGRDDAVDNKNMEIRGKIRNGVVVLEGGKLPPEGAVVRVSYPCEPVIRVSPTRKRVELPLVKTGQPGSVDLTNDQIAEILSEQDVSS